MSKKHPLVFSIGLLIRASIISAGLAAGIADNAFATNYYVAPNGNNSNSGTASSPFATIQKGADVAQAGDTVFVGDGRYSGFEVRRGGTSDANRIVFRAINKHGAVIDSPAPDGSNNVVIYSMSNCVPNHTKDYVTIDGFRIEGAPYRGISMFGTLGLTVRNCYIYDCKDGAQGSNNRNTVYEDNVFDANGKETQYYHQLYFSEGSCCDTSQPLGGYIIRGNVFKNGQVGETIHFMSHTPGYKHENVVIENNLFDHNASVDINAPAVSNSWIRNNVFVTNYGGHGVVVLAQPNPLNCGTPESPRNVMVYNNTFYAPNTRGVYFRYVASLGPNETTDCVIFNNIIVAENEASGIDDRSTGTHHVSTNLIYSANQSGIATTLSQLFVDYQNGDFRLNEGSDAVDQGIASLRQVTAPTTDMVGTPRPPNAVDIGAYEYGAAPPDENLAAPQGVSLSEIQLGCLDVNWQRNTESSLAGYRVYFGPASVASGEASAYEDSVDAGVLTTAQICQLVGRYYVSVRAYGLNGVLSPPSTEQRLFVLGSTPQSAFQVGHWALDEGTGTTAADAWGGADGTLVNGAGWSSEGAVVGALALDGVNDRMQVAGLDVPDGPGLSIAFWCHADDFEIPDARFVSKASGTAEQSHYWMVSTINQTGLRFRLRTDGQTTTVQTAAGQLQAGRWYHVAAVYDGATMRIFLDGAQVANTSKTGIVDVSGGVDVGFGNQPAGAGDLPFDGMIDDVRIYRRPLSAADISALIAMRTNAAPVASFTASATTGTAPLDVDFDASASSDPEGGSLQYDWEFGDGATGSGVTTSHTYTTAGNHNVLLTVTDDHDNIATHSVTINVGEQTTPPAIPLMQIVLEDDPGCVTVTWLPNSEPNLAGYTLYYGTESVDAGEATTYQQNVVLGAVTSWRGCSFGQGRYYFALRARNDAGQLSGFSTELSLDVAGPDVVGPTIIPLDPSDGAAGVDLSSTVRFVVLDDRSSVDTGNMLIRINGQTPADVQLVPESPGYSVTCTPSAAFPPNAEVSVDVTARDTATQPNSSTRSWSFTTVSVPPSAPVGVAATGNGDGSLDLTWTENPENDLAGYRVYFGPAPRSYTDSLSVGLLTAYKISALSDGTYYAALKARNAAGQLSPFSAEVSATVTNPVVQGPTPPQGVQVLESGPGCMQVSWQANNDPQITGYSIHYGTLSVAQGQTGIYFNNVDARNSTSHEICDLSTNTYYVAVRAYRGGGEQSPYSTEKNVDVTAPDTNAPTVTLAYPSANAVDVPQNVKAFLILSDDGVGVDTTSVSIRIGNLVPQSITYTGDEQRLGAVCDLGELLPSSSVISVDVSVSDMADPANTTTRSWSFTTGNATDLTPPMFVSYSPADGSTDVDPATEIVVEIEDDTAVDSPRTQLFINGGEVEAEVEDAGGSRVTVRPRQATLLAPGQNNIRVVAYDTADNRSELLFDFTVADFGQGIASSEEPGAIVPDGYWADDPSRPLEVRNLPVGWTVRIFTTAGIQVRSFENTDEEGMTWLWDFRNDHGQEVTRALYLVRVVDDNGHVQTSGKFVVRVRQ